MNLKPCFFNTFEKPEFETLPPWLAVFQASGRHRARLGVASRTENPKIAVQLAKNNVFLTL